MTRGSRGSTRSSGSSARPRWRPAARGRGRRRSSRSRRPPSSARAPRHAQPVAKSRRARLHAVRERQGLGLRRRRAAAPPVAHAAELEERRHVVRGEGRRDPLGPAVAARALHEDRRARRRGRAPDEEYCEAHGCRQGRLGPRVSGRVACSRRLGQPTCRSAAAGRCLGAAEPVKAPIACARRVKPENRTARPAH